jgi:Leucine-rich repeat (LRR) protein
MPHLICLLALCTTSCGDAASSASPSERAILAKVKAMGGIAKVENGRITISLSKSTVDDQFLDQLKQSPRLVSLNLTDVQLSSGDQGMALLGQLSTLEGLGLYGTNVTDAGLKHLAGLSNLDSLSLGGTKITDDGLVHLKGLRRLKWLVLNETGITDVGLEHVQAMTGLRELYVRRTKVSQKGIEALEKARPEVKVDAKEEED